MPSMAAHSKDVYREACRRSHRILAHYLALRGWAKRVDCLIIGRIDLMYYLGVGAMREKRLGWPSEDIKDLFPYAEAVYYGARVYAGLYVSRRKFPPGAFHDPMSDKKRLRRLRQYGLRATIFKIPDDRRMTAFLAAAATGG